MCKNGISFAEIRDGVLETVGRIVGRMAELKGMATQDPLKSSQDVESYNNEFRDLQKQLRDINKSTFNGVSLFADFAGTKESATSDKAKFKGDDTRDNIIEIFTSSQGSGNQGESLSRSIAFCPYYCGCLGKSWACSGICEWNHRSIRWQLSEVRIVCRRGRINHLTEPVRFIDGVFEQAISNVAYLRAQVGGGMSRLNFAAESISSMETNLRAAIGRIEDVDIAAETANLAKYSILTRPQPRWLPRPTAVTT